MTNQLQFETSPYLLQHADNPVEWYPWGETALSLAKNRNWPIFMSIGYAACHWCHVMEKETFKDPGIADFLNQHFISIKVDREQRPDLDAIYMDAVVSMTGSGGWPMTVFLTPDLKPFFAGTYFPPVRMHNLPSFAEVISGINDLWENNRHNAVDYAKNITTYLEEKNNRASISTSEDERLAYNPQRITETLKIQYDWRHGGWGHAPKFPQAMIITHLLNRAAQGDQSALQMSLHALDAMSRGGMYDLIGGGFHRYSTDSNWYTPHFEKMLYDNALLTRAYLYAYKITGKQWYRTVAEQTLSFIEREMLHPEGGFFSSLDADSDGEEGIFYTWTEDEIQLARSSSQLPGEIYTGIFTGGSTCEGRILPRLSDQLLEQVKTGDTDTLQILNDAFDNLNNFRQYKPRPGLDDKIITSWNGLMLWTFAEAARYLNNSHYMDIARCAADFLLSNLFHDGVLYRIWRNGEYKQPGFLEDYASIAIGLLALYQSDLNPRWYQSAKQIFDLMPDRFITSDHRAYDAPVEAGSDLIYRPASAQDNAFPSGSAMLVQAMLLFSEFEETDFWRTTIDRLVGGNMSLITQYPLGFGQWLQALDFLQSARTQVVLMWPGKEPAPQEFLEETWKAFVPNLVLAGANSTSSGIHPGILRNKSLVNRSLTAYVCLNFTCHAPLSTLQDYKNALNSSTAWPKGLEETSP